MALPFKPSTGGAGGAAIGSVVTGLTAGSVPYGGAGGVLAQDNANLRYGSAGLTIGGAGSFGRYVADQPGLLLVDDGAGSSELLISSSNGAIYLGFDVTGGTFASPTALVANDGILYADWTAKNGAGGYSQVAVWEVLVDAVSGSPGGGLRWSTSNVNGTVYERVRLTSAGTTGVTAPDAASTIVSAGQVEQQLGPLLWKGSTSGLLTHAWPATITSHTLTWPAANAPGALRNDGAGALSWAAPMTVSNVTSTRVLNTTYANAYSNKAVMVMATVQCTTTLLGGSATATPKVSTSATPTVSAGGTIGVASGLAGETDAFQICFVVPAGSSQNYRLDTTSNNGSASLTAWFEATF